MNCWCNEIDYDCNNCEKIKNWKKIKEYDRMKLVSYMRKLNRPTTDNGELYNLFEYINNRGLCISMIPSGVRL